MASVSLRDVTKDNVRAVCELDVGPEQQIYVAPAAVTLAEARFYEEAVVKAIYAGDELVGLIAFANDEEEGWYLWRLMVDQRQQRKGYGRAALDEVIETVKARGATHFLTSYVPGDAGPSGFYATAGFEETGRMLENERILRLAL